MTSLVVAWILQYLLFFISVDGKHLTAVKKHPQLKRRTIGFEPVYDGHSLLYADKTLGNSATGQLAAEVVLEPKLPALDFDGIGEDVKLTRCAASEISLTFHDVQRMQMATDFWTQHDEFLIILSSFGCSNFGMHQPYIASFLDANSTTGILKLSSRPTSLQDCTHRMKFDLGEHVEDRIDPGSRLFPRGKALRPRQQASDVSSAGTTQVLSGSPTISFPAATPTESAAGATATGDISFSQVNQDVPLPMDHFKLTCLNCTASGSLQIVAGGFTVNSGTVDEVIDFFDNGYLQLAASGIRANVSLQLGLEPGISGTINLVPPFPITRIRPVTIAGLITIGPTFQPAIPLTLTLNSEVTITTGFTLEVPDNSLVHLNVSEISASNMTGFSQSKLTPLPFNVNAPNLSFNLSVGFQPRLGLTAATSNSSAVTAGGNAGVYLDLPMLTTTVTKLDNSTSDCQPLTPQYSGEKFSDLIKVEPSVELGGGYYWGWEVGVRGGPEYDKLGGQGFPVFQMSLPSSCLKFDAKSSGLTAASASGSQGAGVKVGSEIQGLWRLAGVCLVAMMAGAGLLL